MVHRASDGRQIHAHGGQDLCYFLEEAAPLTRQDQLRISGQILSLSGNLISTGTNLDTKINNLSGILSTQITGTGVWSLNNLHPITILET